MIEVLKSNEVKMSEAPITPSNPLAPEFNVEDRIHAAEELFFMGPKLVFHGHEPADPIQFSVEMSELVMELIARNKQTQVEKDKWIEDARRHCRGSEYYRDLLVSLAVYLGPEIFVSDDGTKNDEPLVAKVPELVAKMHQDMTVLVSFLSAATELSDAVKAREAARTLKAIDVFEKLRQEHPGFFVPSGPTTPGK